MMSQFSFSFCLALSLTIVPGVSKEGVEDAEDGWSKPSNGLSAKLSFKMMGSSSSDANVDTPRNIVHPMLKLRNESDAPISFLWCVYDAGNFAVKDSQKKSVQRAFPPRSGPQSAKVIAIKPKETVELDAYDYGWGVTSNKDIYIFNTTSFQARLKSGVYFVDYELVVDKESLNKMLKSYDWIRDDPSSLWMGDITLKDVHLRLE